LALAVQSGYQPLFRPECPSDALIRDARFAGEVDDIVVECGNSLYQGTLDGYMNGDDVPLEQLATGVA
jgi:hypothetical protein